MQLAEPSYHAGKGDGSVEVCVELTSLPAGGLECVISVTLGFTDGLKAGIEMYKDRIMYHCLPLSSLIHI